MTKEDFKKKYHGQVVAISYPMGLGGFNYEREVAEKTNQLRNICGELGLKVTELPDMAHVHIGLRKKTFAVTDPDKSQAPYSGQPSVAISVEEFLEDFGHYVKEEEGKGITKVLDVLTSMKIKDVYPKHVGMSRNMKQLTEDGFIQGQTTNEASLWWNPRGRRLLFVRGEGVFELTDKVKENA